MRGRDGTGGAEGKTRGGARRRPVAGPERWVDHPPTRYRKRDADEGEAAEAPRKELRVVRGRGGSSRARRGAAAPKPVREHPARRRRRQETEAVDELARLAGRKRSQALAELSRAAASYADGRERDAARILRTLRDAYPEAAGVRELLGLAQYRLGYYAAAIKELEAFVALTGSVEQHPVLMDCYRGLGKHAVIEELWRELAAVSPSPALVAEGRIVLAGSLADGGDVDAAIATLSRRSEKPKRVQEHHLRLWYALADLEERAGNIPRARSLFLQVSKADSSFADVAERLLTLG